MHVVLLRTLTRKSILGFGNFKDVSIQNMIDMRMERELLHIYYTCRNIDFCQDLKDELCISGEREINKKEKQEERYIKKTYTYIAWCLKEMLNKRGEEQNEINKKQMYKTQQYKKKQVVQRQRVLSGTKFSKGALRSKNQNTFK